jgi:DNA modification methylase
MNRRGHAEERKQPGETNRDRHRAGVAESPQTYPLRSAAKSGGLLGTHSAYVVFGDSSRMPEIPDEHVHLIVTSPPYFNAPFDYPDLFPSYDVFLDLMRRCFEEWYRVMAPGRIAAIVCDDTLIRKKKYPVVADLTRLMCSAGFDYRDRIVWVKPEGYIRISRRSGVLLQNPYPMYFYPDNLQESILVFSKGAFDYSTISLEAREASRVDLDKFKREKWFLSVWRITNVLPNSERIELGIAAFPEEIPFQLIQLYSYKGEIVLDPFLGSGTTTKVALKLGRRCIGYELDTSLLPVIQSKIGATALGIFANRKDVGYTIRDDAKALRATLQERVNRQRSVTRK